MDLSHDYFEACETLRKAVRCEWGAEISGTGYSFRDAQQRPQTAAAIEHHLPVHEISFTETWKWCKTQRDWGTWVYPMQNSDADYQVYVPFVNCTDLLIKALDSLLEHALNVMVIDQSINGAPLHEIFDRGAALYRTSERSQFTQMMNWAQLSAWRRNKRFNVFMHNDAVAVDDALTRVLDVARKTDHLGVLFTNYDALAVFGVEACCDVGFWDETFKWYSSDNDYYRRLKLRGWKVEDSNIHVEHLEQQTAKSDPQIWFEARHRTAHLHYIAKWGGTFGEEKFEIPFDGKSCSLLFGML